MVVANITFNIFLNFGIGSCFIYIIIIIETSYTSFNKNLEARGPVSSTPRYNFSRRLCSWVSYLFDCKPRLI